jgi:hypothetical protein
MRFSYISLLDAAALGIRVEAKNELELKLGQIAERPCTRMNLGISLVVCVSLGNNRFGKEMGGASSALSHWLGLIQRAKISLSAFESLASQGVAGFRDNEMAALAQRNPYQCDQCGTSNIVAVPLLYQQETRTYSNTFGWGSSQSASAQAAAPPRPRGRIWPFVLWGFPILLFFLHSLIGISAILDHPKIVMNAAPVVAACLFLGLVCLGGLLANLRRISRYNREVYSRLLWDWQHTYMCRRCGNFCLIAS